MGYKGKLSGAQIDAIPDRFEALELSMDETRQMFRPVVIGPIPMAQFMNGEKVQIDMSTEHMMRISIGIPIVMTWDNGLRSTVVVSRGGNLESSHGDIIIFFYLLSSKGSPIPYGAQFVYNNGSASITMIK